MSTWVLRQWPIPLVAATALIVMLAAQRFGAGVELPAYLPAAQADAPAAKLQGLPLAFEENHGQTDPQVRFITHGSGYTQFITAREVVWRLDGGQQDHAVRMSFPGALLPGVHGEDAIPGRTNYLKGRDPAKWVAGVQQFAAVRLTDLYPGISLKLYGTRSRPEYDFILEPGAAADAIRLRFAGAEQVEVGTRGELIVRTSSGELIHHMPVAYQRDADGQSRTIDVRFVQVAPDELRFELGRYDHSRQLVIDPIYEYSTFMGGDHGVEAVGGVVDPYQAITVNAAGEVYAAGVTNSDDFPTTAGVLQPALKEDLDFYIVKLNAAGDALLYSTYIGGTGDEVGVGGIAVTPNDEVLFGGTSQSRDFPTTPGSLDPTSKGVVFDTDAVALRLNATGSALVYSTYLSSSATETVLGFAADSAGSIYLAGASPPGATVPLQTTAGVINTTGDQYIAKLLPDGSGLAYLTRFGTAFGADIRIRALALDSSNNVYLTGLTFSMTELPLVNPFDSTLSGGFDVFVTKINSTATGIVYSTYLGGSNSDEPRAIAVDAAGSAYVAGTTGDFPVTPGAFRTTFSNNYLGFVTKLAPAGNSLVWATYFARAPGGSTNPIALDSSNRVYLAIEGPPQLDLRVGESPETCLANVASPAIVRLSADGSTVEFGMRIGAPQVFSGGFDISAHLLNDIAVDSGNNVYVIGSTNSGDFPTYKGFKGSHPPTISPDAFIAKLSDATPPAMPTLAFSAATYSVSEAPGVATITVNRTGRAGGPVKVRATASAGTATATADYAPTDVTLEWRNGDLTPKTFNIPIVADGVAEGAETVNLALTKNWCLGDLGTQSTAVLTINDGAPPPPPPPPSNGTLQLSAATYSAAEGAGNATITVTRTGGSSGAVSARLATSNGTAAAAADYTATDTIVNFADGDTTAKTVSVPILQDTTDEPDETVTLTLSTPTGGATLGAQTSAVLTITDDDPTPAPPPPPPAPPGGGGGGGGGGGSTNVLMLLALAATSAVRRFLRPARR
ncbi:MAG TPA: Calx-beta domain-containing protein [Steroidobacteraceae bacterium]|nr:Calx-beta domain-containing protein [Steroidobacteraceae bacterium]